MSLGPEMPTPVALVIGGMRGIGFAISKRFVAEGYQVYATSRTPSHVASSGEAAGISIVAMDVNSSQSIEAVRGQFRQNGVVPKVLVANAGIVHDQLFPTCDFEAWVHVISTNLIGNARVIRAFVPEMVKARSGRIVIISSISGIRGNVGQSAYGASKGGLIAFTKALAREIGRFGIRVNAVSPGIIRSDMSSLIPERLLKERIESSALKHEGEADDVAELVLSLCGPAGDYITGQNIVVDGGIVM